jgi:hypothetical protein
MTQAGRLLACLIGLAACAKHRPDNSGGEIDAAPGGIDAAIDGAIDALGEDAALIDAPDGDGPLTDAFVVDTVVPDAFVPDAFVPDAFVPDAFVPDAFVPDAFVPDAFVPDAFVPDAPTGIITGGPCLSGRPGATAYRIRWAGNGSGSTAYVVYEGNGLPDHSRDHAAAYGYQIGFTPTFEDVFLAQGGLRLDGSDFVDIELTTVGLSSITNATLSIYGRSFNTTTSGSFHWQTFEGTGAAPSNLVSNSAPYQWYSADMTTEISPGNSGVLLRIKAGPSSGVLVVNRIEICMTAT